jgi:SPASM domain peptide maturase of grasp-with-spasm system
MSGQYVFLISDCVPVRGHAVSAIYDLTRGKISTFPSAYFPFFELFRKHRLHELRDMLSEEDRAGFSDFMAFLVGNEYVHMVEDLSAFPERSSAWETPCVIHNAVIDVDARHHDYQKLVAELDALGCQHLQLRGYSTLFGVAELAVVARLCHGTSIQTLQAIVVHEPALTDDDYAAVVMSNHLIKGLTVHSANEDRVVEVNWGARALMAVAISFRTRKLESHFDCGTIIATELLAPSTRTFNELHHFNGCLNRKASVDVNGHIRNCPAMAKSFGHHRHVGLAKIAADVAFQKAWRARKDDIEVCRDCPYRYACTDCRAFLEDPEADDSKPLKCGYDPYTNTWSDWRTQPRAMGIMEEYRKRRRLPLAAAQ